MNKTILSLLAAVAVSLPNANASTTATIEGTTFTVDTLAHYYLADGLTQTSLKFTGNSRMFMAYVTTLDRKAAPNIRPQIIMGRDSTVNAEALTSMARRHTTDGNQVLAGINGDFFITSSFAANHALGNQILGYPNTTCIIDGKMAAPDIIDKASNENCLVIGTDGMWIDNTSLKYRLLNNGGDIIVDAYAINYPRLDNQLIVYNSYAGKYTNTPAGGREIALVMKEGSKWAINKSVTFTVTGAWHEGGCMKIPENGIVISCGKDYHNDFIDGLTDGSVVKLKTVLALPAFENLKPNVTDVIGGDVRVLNCGNVVTEATRFINTPTAQYSRSLVGYSEDRNLMVICAVDAGSGSSGVTYYESGSLMRFLGCWDALDFDGGGSTHMWSAAHGTINTLRDGSERAVGNALFFTLEAPTDKKVDAIRFADHTITLPRYGLYTPKMYGYNQHGQLVDTLFTGHTLSAQQQLGSITADGQSLLATGQGLHCLQASYGASNAQLVVNVDASSPAQPAATNIIVDKTHPWTVPLQAQVGTQMMPVAPQAYTWNSSHPEVAAVNSQGQIIAGNNGQATLTGTNASGSVSLTATVQNPTAASQPVMPDVTPENWKISKSGVSDATLTGNPENGSLTVDYTVTTGRLISLTLTRETQIWGIPEAIEVVLGNQTTPLTKANVKTKYATNTRPIQTDFEGNLQTLKVPVSAITDPSLPANYPISFYSLQVYPQNTGQNKLAVSDIRALYATPQGIEAISMLNPETLKVNITATSLQIEQPASLHLYNLAGQLVDSAENATSIQRPSTPGAYLLQAQTEHGTTVAKLSL